MHAQGQYEKQYAVKRKVNELKTVKTIKMLEQCKHQPFRSTIDTDNLANLPAYLNKLRT
jgi:hypothetical protein